MPPLDNDTREQLFAIGARGGGQFEKSGELFESIIKDIYSTILSPGDIAVDGGAHVGIHTFPMSERVGPMGRVYAVEPIPRLARIIEKAVADAGRRNISVVGKALYDRITTVKFHHIKNNPAYSGIEERIYDFNPDVEIINVPTTTIDDLLRDRWFLRLFRETRRWRFCKLDLEGGELRALQGSRNAIGKFKPLIVFENGQESSARNYGYSRDEWFAFFENFGYKVFDLLGRPFERGDWLATNLPWYFIAVASHSEDEQFVHEKLPDLLRRYANS
jgi:FkbM family methyltransferase